MSKEPAIEGGYDPRPPGSETPRRVLHVVQTLDPEFGGPARVAIELAEAQARSGDLVELIAARTSRASLADTRESTVRLTVTELPVSWSPLTYCRGMARLLWRTIGRSDVVHVHGAYRLPPTTAAWITWFRGRPLVSRPHGTYDRVLRESPRGNRVLRYVYEQLLERPVLARPSTVVHCTSESEAEELRSALKLAGPVVVVGNGVATPPESGQPSPEVVRHSLGLHPESVVLLYLGRITAKKRLDLLLAGFAAARLEQPRLELVVAGPDQEGLRRALDAAHHGVTWLPHADERMRELLFSAADVFVLTSGGENFGVTAVEAAARGLPLILTARVASSALFDSRSCVIVELDPDSIGSGILAVASLDRDALNAMGMASRQAWERAGTWQAVLPAMDAMYSTAQRVARSG